MQQRRPLGPLMPTAKASSRSMSQLWHKGIFDPARDLETLSWSWAGVLWSSSAQPPPTHHWRLKMPRASGPQVLTLITSVEPRVTHSGRKAYPLSHWHRGHLFCYVRLLQKNQGLSGLCYGGWWFNIYTNNWASPLHTSRCPIFLFFSHIPKVPHSYSWRDILSQFKASVISPSPPSDLA